MKQAEYPGVDVYPVSVLAALLGVARAYGREVRSEDAETIELVRGYAWSRLRGEARQVRERAAAGRWREVRNAFNGYLAEPYDFPERMTRCGSGWTRARAMRSLRRHGWPG
jgi:hypothetical protein